MIDGKLARLRAHQNNINRYRRLLGTELTDLERRFIERRLSEERSAMKSLTASTVPPGLGVPIGAVKMASTPEKMSNHGDPDVCSISGF